jgi:hypothetical protein
MLQRKTSESLIRKRFHLLKGDFSVRRSKIARTGFNAARDTLSNALARRD